MLKDSEAIAYFEQLCNGEASSDEFSSECSDSDDDYVPDKNDESDFEEDEYVRSGNCSEVNKNISIHIDDSNRSNIFCSSCS